MRHAPHTSPPPYAYRYSQVTLLHIILLILTLLMLLAYVFLMLRPYIRNIEREVTRMAGMLSHVPNEMDVAAHGKKVLRKAGLIKQMRS